MSVLAIRGERSTGAEVRGQNVTAAMAVANVVKTSLGPCGLDKMLVDNTGDVTITNDGATILKQLEVEHPAGKVLVELSNLQDTEVGDGTTSVVIIAAELLKRANELVRNHIHPTSIISGFQRAKKEACRFIADQMTLKVSDLGEPCLVNAARTSMSSKIIGDESDFFANLAVQAMQRVKTVAPDGKTRYPVKAVSILKVHGKSSRESELINGYALHNTRASQGMPASIKNAKIALVDFDLRKAKMSFGVQVLVNDPSKLEAIRQKETEMTKSRIELLLNAGANVVLTSKGIDDEAMKYFVDRGCIAVRRVEKTDLRRISKATGAKLMLSLASINEEGEEAVDPDCLGEVEEVHERRVGDGQLMFITGCKSTAAQTILLRGPNDYYLDEVERSLHDSLCIVKRTLESKRVVPGGGAVEAALSVYLESVAETMGSREQLAVAEYAQALLVIPKCLATNAALDAIDLIAKLRAYHNSAQTQAKESNKWAGLDLIEGRVRDNVKAGVLEPAISKIKSIRFATEAAITILRIDDAIKMNPKEEPKNPHDH